MKSVIVLLAIALAGCATTPDKDKNVLAIQASCDDQHEQQTVINGHAYFCMDYEQFDAQMKAIARHMHDRGA